LGSRPQLTQTDTALPAIHLRELLEDAVERSTADGVLLSGGLGMKSLIATCTTSSQSKDTRERRHGFDRWTGTPRPSVLGRNYIPANSVLVFARDKGD
jgi:hypothetical protein